ncbi:radical SAM protein [Candidatus Bathyarchaeota archaeon]|nr:radical SAM protein [Candidatus Bathyarchaeota archaeon]
MWALARPDALEVLHDEKARRGYRRYFDVMEDRKLAKFIIARKIPASFAGETSSENLWSLHERLTEEFYQIEKKVDDKEINVNDLPFPEKSYLDLKIKLAEYIVSNCHLCERRCNVNRFLGELGYCKCGSQILVSSMFEHLGEEPEITPSFTIFTMGCNLTCRHCQNWAISQWFEAGSPATALSLARAIDRFRKAGCRNANLVGGDPVPWTHQWLEVFRHVTTNVPVFWNTNGYYSEETAKLLAGFVDIYKIDFKYGNNDCATRISNAPRFWEVCTRNLLLARKYGDLLIRVLVLPGHLECCLKPILYWIAKNLGPETRTNIMWQYRPEYKANELPELRRRLTREEMQASLKLAEEAGLLNYIT